MLVVVVAAAAAAAAAVCLFVCFLFCFYVAGVTIQMECPLLTDLCGGLYNLDRVCTVDRLM